MAFEHKSGIAGAHDRAADHPEWQGGVFVGDRFIQAADLNDIQTILRERNRRVSDLVAKDGDRVEGAAVIYIAADEQLILTAGRIYLRGDVFPIAGAVIDEVPATGEVIVGVRVSTAYIGHEENPALLGLVDGSEAQGEPGSHREAVSIAWAIEGDDGAGDFISVYQMRDGTIIDQTPPPQLDGFTQALKGYDFGAHGSYIVSGCRVTALGKVGSAQSFSIEEGEANIRGIKRTRLTALRHLEEEDFAIESVAGEPHSWPTGASATFTTNRFPINAVNSALVTKEVTVTVTRGAIAGGSDNLPNNSVSSLIEVKQGGTTYVQGTDYKRTGDAVDWSLAGAEPATGSSYTAKYRYLALVTPDSRTDTTITLSGGVDGATVILGYDWKLPRIDILALDDRGLSVYIKGVSARENPLPPMAGTGVLNLAEIHNNWMGAPAVVNSGIRSVPYEEQWRIYNRVFEHERLLQLERIKSGIDAREPTAKKGIFVDPFTSDFYRDFGVSQTGSVSDGVLELAIEPTIYVSSLNVPVMLDWVEEVIVAQELVTGCLKINPYQNFNPMPAGLKITPAADYWVEAQTVWASPVTQEFNRGVRADNGPLVVSSASTQAVGSPTSQQAQFLRTIPIAFRIEGFGAGEILTALTFDDISVKPPGTQTADSNGVIAGSFTIPSNIPTGSKRIKAAGQGGGKAEALFVGNGVIQTTVLRSVTTIERWTRPVVTQSNDRDSGSDRGFDPLAQTFTPSEARHIVGVDIRLCALGSLSNNLLVHQVGVEVGIPNEEVVAEAFVPMAGAEVGWKSARYNFPVVTPSDRASAFVVKTDDAGHSLSIAKLGEFDAAKQQWVGAQPYTTGTLLSSANAQTWTPHQGEDLAFRLIAARFTSNTKTITLGSFDLVDASDLQVRADVELPSPDCGVVFEIVRADSSVYRLLPYQVLKLSEYITETVQLRAVLTGTPTLSPILYPPVMLIAGKIAASGTYITRAFKLGAAVKLTSYFKAALPSGSAATIHYDKADNTWVALPLIATEALSDPGWVERKHEAGGITATQGRIRITITGGPAARPRIGDFGAAIM